MIWIIEDKMPHISFFTCEKLHKDGIRYAYEDITSAYNGISDFVKILDGIYDGIYSLAEVMVAGIIVTDALDGYFIKESCWERAKYIRINGCDVILLAYGSEVLTGTKIAGCEFDGDNGKRYRLRGQKVRNGRKMLKEMRIDRANDQSSEDE